MSDADRTTALVGALFAAAVDAAESVDGARADVTSDVAGNRARGDTGSPRLVEVGIGERTGIAAALVDRGARVHATDVVERSVPDSVEFKQDDLQDPDPSQYADADLLYALRLPTELHAAFAALASDLGLPAAFTTLGGDPATVPTAPEQLPGGETLHWLGDRAVSPPARDRYGER